MKRQIKRVFFPALALMVLLCSCTKETSNYNYTGTEKETKALLTPEELFAGTDLTEEDFEDIDVNAFIRQFSLTEDSLNGRNVRNCYDLYTAEPAVTYEDDYRYLLESPLKKLEKGMSDNVKTVYFYSNRLYGEWNVVETRLFDFENKRVCEGFSPLRETSEGDKEEIQSVIKESGIEKLSASSNGVNVFGEGYEIIIESEDGRIAHLKGENTMPESVEKFIDGVLEIGQSKEVQ